MEATLTVPGSDLVRRACEQFDRENGVTERALADLFAAYPANNNPSHILLKVVALNSLYTTRILAVLKLAHQIAAQGMGLDAALAAGSPEAVDLIAQTRNEDRDSIFYSFATKYCNWHRPNLYPIYDSRVEKYLWLLKKHDLFPSEALSSRDDLTSYPRFCVVMTALREQFGLGSFTFKQIDKFLWSQGEAIWAVADEEARAEAAETQPPEPASPDAQSPDALSSPEDLKAFEVDPAVVANEDALEVYHPSADTQRGVGKLFLDMFSANPPSASNG